MENKGLGRVNSDILIALLEAKKLGWVKINKSSIEKILYLSSVLYSFVYKNKKNPFSKDYNFIIDLHGPYTESVEYSLAFLKSNQFIMEDKLNGTIEMGKRKIPSLYKVGDIEVKKDWISTIIHILSIYDENKIYEFISRDPEYQDKILTRDPSGINIGKSNETIKVLNEFRKVFEENIEDLKDSTIDPKRYLELYFEYVFSTILKGEDK